MIAQKKLKKNAVKWSLKKPRKRTGKPLSTNQQVPPPPKGDRTVGLVGKNPKEIKVESLTNKIQAKLKHDGDVKVIHINTSLFRDDYYLITVEFKDMKVYHSLFSVAEDDFISDFAEVDNAKPVR